MKNKRNMYYVHWRIFILVDVVTLLYMELDWMSNVVKNAGLYTLATKEWDMWELLLDVQLTLEIE